MKIRILHPGDEAALASFLLPRIESSMFLLGNLRKAGLEDNGQRYQGTYAAVFDGQEIVGAVAHYWNMALVLQAPLELLDTLWQTAVSATQRPITRVIGPRQQVQHVLGSLKIPPSNLQMDEPEFLYRLRLADLQVPWQLQNGLWHGRLANQGDIDLMTRWRVGYALEIMGETDSPRLWRLTRDGVIRYLQEGISLILEDGGKPVSTSSFNTSTTELVQVGGVWTPPELRSRGYGRGAVAASLLAVREQGVHTAILFTGEGNFPAQKAYTALGFEHIGDYRITLLKEPLSLSS